jgi:hypothetical protein
MGEIFTPAAIAFYPALADRPAGKFSDIVLLRIV